MISTISTDNSLQTALRSSEASPTRQPCATCGTQGPFLPTLDILLRCSQCGLVFANPQLSYADVIGLYGSNYFIGDEYVDYLGDKTAIQRSFRRKIAYMYCSTSRLQRVFEIGSAYGFFLELAQEHWEVSGIDVAEEPTAYARNASGLDV